MKDILRNLAVYASARALPSLMTFLFTIICIESLTAAEYGGYSLILLPLTMAASFAGSLAGQPMLRFGRELSLKGRRSGLFGVPTMVAVIVLPLLLLHLYVADRSMIVMSISVALVMVTAVLESHRGYFIAMSSAVSILRIDAVRSAASVLLLILFLKMGYATSWAPLVSMACAATLALLAIPAYIKSGEKEGQRLVDAAYIRYGFWVACWMAVIVLLQLLERIIIESQFGISAVGSYSAIADPIAMVISAVGGIVANALMPRFIEAWNDHKLMAIRQLTLASLAAVFFAASLCFVAGSVVLILDFGRWAVLLRSNIMLSLLLLTGITLWQAGVFVHKPLELRGKTGAMFACVVVSLLAFILMAVPMVKLWGAEGIAVAKLLAGGVYLGLIMVFIRRVRPA